MENHLNFIEKNKAIIRKSWLEYYQENATLFDRITENWFTRVGTPDGGYRVKAEWILGFLAGKHRNFSKLLYTLYISNDNLEKIVETLGLNFDPRKELEKTKNSSQNSQETDKSAQEIPFSDLQEGFNNFQNEMNKLFKGFDLNT
ncbi:DUF5331 domain-containing protein [Geminocystis sp. CENA526]|uniref:DUF5331 domain-containing protein n=1 Tax=Geminocystis sp. CENA526 TaxID=1355871 RepID=UPI003D6E7E3B